MRFTIRELLLVGVIVGMACTSHAAEDPTGSWIYWVKAGDNLLNMVLNLKRENDAITGTVAYRWEDGPAHVGYEISKGSFKNDEVRFSVVRKQANGKQYTQTYTGKVNGDTIVGKIETNRGVGRIQSTDWKAGRQK